MTHQNLIVGCTPEYCVPGWLLHPAGAQVPGNRVRPCGDLLQWLRRRGRSVRSFSFISVILQYFHG